MMQNEPNPTPALYIGSNYESSLVDTEVEKVKHKNRRLKKFIRTLGINMSLIYLLIFLSGALVYVILQFDSLNEKYDRALEGLKNSDEEISLLKQGLKFFEGKAESLVLIASDNAYKVSKAYVDTVDGINHDLKILNDWQDQKGFWKALGKVLGVKPQ